MSSYNIELTVAPDINRLDGQMRPFEKKLPDGRSLHPALALDIDIKHLSLVFRADPMPKATDIDHQEGMLYFRLPSQLGGYHAKNVILGSRGLGALSFIASNTDLLGEHVCALSPGEVAAAVAEFVSCLHDAVDEEVICIPASELLLKELRLKAVSHSGKRITRLEQLAKQEGALLVDADLDLPIDSPWALHQAIAHRVKKACSMGVHLENLEGRLKEIYEFCTEGCRLETGRAIERPMPGAITYRTFSEALSHVIESFEGPSPAEAVSNSGGDAKVDASLNDSSTVIEEPAVVIDASDIEAVEVESGLRTNESLDLFYDDASSEAITATNVRVVTLGKAKLARALLERTPRATLDDAMSAARRSERLLKRTRYHTQVERLRINRGAHAGAVRYPAPAHPVAKPRRQPQPPKHHHGVMSDRPIDPEVGLF